MELNLNNNIINNAKENAFIKHLIEELKNYLEKNKMPNNNVENKEENLLENVEEKMITTYRDKMNLERNEILNNYAKQTSNKGQMYYIYSKSPQKLDTYNMCICEEGKSHNVIEINKQELPYGAEIGSVIRKKEEKYTLDYESYSTTIPCLQRSKRLDERFSRRNDNREYQGDYQQLCHCFSSCRSYSSSYTSDSWSCCYANANRFHLGNLCAD